MLEQSELGSSREICVNSVVLQDFQDFRIFWFCLFFPQRDILNNFWRLEQGGRLNECSRWKPGWRFTAGFELELNKLLNYLWFGMLFSSTWWIRSSRFHSSAFLPWSSVKKKSRELFGYSNARVKWARQFPGNLRKFRDFQDFQDFSKNLFFLRYISI